MVERGLFCPEIDQADPAFCRDTAVHTTAKEAFRHVTKSEQHLRPAISTEMIQAAREKAPLNGVRNVGEGLQVGAFAIGTIEQFCGRSISRTNQ